MTINAVAVNDAPALTGPSNFVKTENETPGFQLEAEDVEGDSLAFSIVGGVDANNFQIDEATGELQLNTPPDFENPNDSNNDNTQEVVVRVTDAAGDSDDQAVTVTIDNVDEAPFIDQNAVLQVNEFAEETILSTELSASDVDTAPEQIVFTLTSLPADGELLLDGEVLQAESTFTQQDINFGLISYRNLNSTLSDSFEFEVSDGTTTLSDNTFNIAIEPVRSSSVDDSFVVDEDQSLTGNVADNDEVFDGSSFVLDQAPNSAQSFTLNPDGSFNYQPLPDFNGSDSFTYSLVSSDGTITVSEVNITVNPINDIPVAVSDQFEVGQEGSVLDIISNDSDIDGDGIVAMLVQLPTQGTLSFLQDGSLFFQPFEDASGTDTFTYVPSDNFSTGEAVTVTIDISEPLIPGNVPGVSVNDGQDVTVIDSSPTIEESTTMADEILDRSSSIGETTTPEIAAQDSNLGSLRDTSPSGIEQNSNGDGANTFEGVAGEVEVEVETRSFDEFSLNDRIDLITNRQLAVDILRHIANGIDQAAATGEEIDRIRQSIGLSVAFDANYLFDQIQELENLPSFDATFGKLEMTLGAVTVVGSAGYILWALRGGVLVAAALAQLPGWTNFDPLPLLDSVERSSGKKDEEDLTGYFGA